MGLAFQLAPDTDSSKDSGRQLKCATVIHDGTGVRDSETYHTTFHSRGKNKDELALETKRVTQEILEKIRELAVKLSAKVRSKSSIHPSLRLSCNTLPTMTSSA